MNKFSKYLLTITLFFSVFSFSGYTENSFSPQKLAIQTEILFVNKRKASNRIASYKKVVADKIKTKLFCSFLNHKQSIFTINILFKILFDSVSKHLYTFETTNRMMQIKTIPQAFKEDIFTAHLG